MLRLPSLSSPVRAWVELEEISTTTGRNSTRAVGENSPELRFVNRMHAERETHAESTTHADLEEAFAACVRALLQLARSGSNDEQAIRLEAAAQMLGCADGLSFTPGTAESAACLTAREREIADLVLQGLSNRQIAEHLVVSERTVDTHVQNLLRKLDLHSRSHVGAALGARAVRRIVRIDTPTRTPSSR